MCQVRQESAGKFRDVHKIDKWVQGRCMKMMKVSSILTKGFVCEGCVETQTRIVESVEELSLCDQVEFVRSFCYLGHRLNPSCGSKAGATARKDIRWTKFRECEELLHGRKLLSNVKGRIYQSCLRSAMLSRSETWCLRENEMAILRRTAKELRQYWI